MDHLTETSLTLMTYRNVSGLVMVVKAGIKLMGVASSGIRMPDGKTETIKAGMTTILESHGMNGPLMKESL